MATHTTAPAAPTHTTPTSESHASSDSNERSTHLAFNAFVILLALALIAVAWTFMNL